MKTDIIPIRIDDHLIDAYVESYFESDYSMNHLQTVACNVLSENREKLVKIPVFNLEGQKTNKHYYSDEKFRFFIEDNKIGVNCIGSYPGWNIYMHTIMEIYHSISRLVRFRRVRIKFVSQWPNISIFNKLDGIVKLNQFEDTFPGSTLSFSAIWKGRHVKPKVTVTLRDRVVVNEAESSIVDIDCSFEILEDEQDIQSNNFVTIINELHNAEKYMFFKLLNMDFINTLNPVWPK